MYIYVCLNRPAVAQYLASSLGHTTDYQNVIVVWLELNMAPAPAPAPSLSWLEKVKLGPEVKLETSLASRSNSEHA